MLVCSTNHEQIECPHKCVAADELCACLPMVLLHTRLHFACSVYARHTHDWYATGQPMAFEYENSNASNGTAITHSPAVRALRRTNGRKRLECSSSYYLALALCFNFRSSFFVFFYAVRHGGTLHFPHSFVVNMWFLRCPYYCRLKCECPYVCSL